jgi:hypothetical protein
MVLSQCALHPAMRAWLLQNDLFEGPISCESLASAGGIEQEENRVG